MENNKEKVYEDDKHFADSNNGKKNNNKNNNVNVDKKNFETLEILFRLFFFNEELKRKMNNYNNFKEEERIQSGFLMNKDLMKNFKTYFEYDKFVKIIKESNKFKEFKDRNFVISDEELEKNEFLLTIISEFSRENAQFIIDINSKENKDNNYFKDENCKISIKEKLNYLEEFELVNSPIYQLITKKLSLKNSFYYCKYFFGKSYIYILAYISSKGISFISEVGKFDNNNIFKTEFVFKINDTLVNEFLRHIMDKGIDNLVNDLKSKGDNEYSYVFEKGQVIYYNLYKDNVKVKVPDNNPKPKINKKNTFDTSEFKKNIILQKLLYLYCFYSCTARKIYSSNNNNELKFQKGYLVDEKVFLDIKLNLDYKILKDELESNEQIKKIMDNDYINMIDIDSIIKLLPQNYIQKYHGKKIEVDKSKIIQPMITTINLNQNELVMIYEKFEILDKILFEFFFPKMKNQVLEVEYTCHKGKVIINLPKELNEKKNIITLIGELEPDDTKFIRSYVIIYDKEKYQKKHIDNIKSNDLNKYLDAIKKEYTQIQLEGKNIGTIIKMKEENPPPSPPKERKKIGLQNIGATCYMNATLQCFSNIKQFVRFFKKDKSKANILSDKKTLSYSFKLVIDNLWPDDEAKSKSYFAPDEFKAKISEMNPLFQGIAANDAKDLINFIIMTLHEELNTINDNIILSDQIPNQTNKQAMFEEFSKDFQKKFNSLASQLFYAFNYNITQCTECGIQLYNYQIYFFIIFPLEEVRKFVSENNNNLMMINQINQINQSQQNQNVVDIYQCFEFDRRICFMSGDNAMFCNNCQKSTNCNICTNLVYGPNILILILNRGKGKQFDVKLNFVEELDLTSYIEFKNTGVKYKLIGVITHLGESGMSGHFIAFCKDPLNFNWYKFNDAIVSPVSDFKKEVIDFGMPYLLFYQKESENQNNN